MKTLLVLKSQLLDPVLGFVQFIELFLFIEFIDDDRLDALKIDAMPTEEISDKHILVFVLDQ